MQLTGTLYVNTSISMVPTLKTEKIILPIDEKEQFKNKEGAVKVGSDLRGPEFKSCYFFRRACILNSLVSVQR